MFYNPKTFKWEGNDEVMAHFDAAVSSPPRPALISNVNTCKKSIQVVNGMVFDPEQMCWVKLSDDAESEADPFEGLDDLEDASTKSASVSGTGFMHGPGHFSVGEEFDVGRQFIKRQRDEEVKWRQQVQGWISGGRRNSQRSRAYLQDIYTLLMEDE